MKIALVSLENRIRDKATEIAKSFLSERYEEEFGILNGLLQKKPL